MAVFALIATAVCLLDRAGHGIRTPVGYHEVRDDPFGNDPNDLPLSRICAKLEHDLLGIEPPPGNAPAYLDD